jgi:hypothetical protein
MTTKPCKFCCQLIPSAATRCTHCGGYVGAPRVGLLILLVLVSIVVFIVLPFMLLHCGEHITAYR